ncbi:hypothetical protein [Nostoc sp. 106C]|nr:hypothetical protein [Nostoc sp. 106C]
MMLRTLPLRLYNKYESGFKKAIALYYLVVSSFYLRSGTSAIASPTN